MLMEILKIIERDGFIKRESIASELDVMVEIVDDGLDQLVRMGFLKEEATGESCSSFCSKCPFANNCSKDVVKTYSLTNKSMEARR